MKLIYAVVFTLLPTDGANVKVKIKCYLEIEIEFILHLLLNSGFTFLKKTN